MANQADEDKEKMLIRDDQLVAVIADEVGKRGRVLHGRACSHRDSLDFQDTITGFLLAGLGNIDIRKTSNYLMVDGSESRPPSI